MKSLSLFLILISLIGFAKPQKDLFQTISEGGFRSNKKPYQKQSGCECSE